MIRNKMDKIEELLTRGVANIIPGRAELEKVLRSDKKLNIYLGVDPTAPRMHIGHGVNIRKLQQFVDLGHNVTFLIGDFTTKVGDNSDKESERPILTDAQIEVNWQTYKAQASKFLDFSKVTLKHNSEWLSKLGFADVIRLSQQYSLNDYLSREIMKKKLEAGVSIRLDEVFYPLMQGYDSYFMDTDVQVGAADQTFNMQAGRSLQKKLRNKDSFVLVNHYLTGTDGRKMSKSWGNAIWLDDSPEDIAIKIFNLRDNLIEEYFTLATKLSISEIKDILNELEQNNNPIEMKIRLAKQIIGELHSSELALRATAHLESMVKNKEIKKSYPIEINLDTFGTPTSNATVSTIAMGTASVQSKSELKRLVEQGGVKINREKITDPSFEPKPGDIIEFGNRRVIKTKHG